MLFIGICGASGSGKSTLAENLRDKIDQRVVLLAQDSYYRDHSHLPFEQRERVNYDEPSAFDHDALYQDILALREGKPITRKRYDYSNHCRADLDEMIQPQDVVLLEGIHTFYDKRLRDLMDMRIFIRVDADVCLLRRVQRDIVERGRTIDSIARQYAETVKPMYEQYIKNYIQYADLIVAGGGKNAKISDILSFYINGGQVASRND